MTTTALPPTSPSQRSTQPSFLQDVAQPGSQTEPVLQATDLVMDYRPAVSSTRGTREVPVAAGIGAATAPALDHVDFFLGSNRSVAVMGPSGSGKSTLLHVLAGILTPTQGRVLYQGDDIGALTDAERTKLRRQSFGFVFQSGQLLPELSAVENIALPMMLGGAPYRRAADCAMLWLERLGLHELATHRPGEMSGGQLQRVAIARALSIKPHIVFADEPTGALDQTTGQQVMTMLMQAAKANHAAVVVVTHDPSVARFCDSTVSMQDGHLIVDYGRTRDEDSTGYHANADVAVSAAVPALRQSAIRGL